MPLEQNSPAVAAGVHHILQAWKMNQESFPAACTLTMVQDVCTKLTGVCTESLSAVLQASGEEVLCVFTCQFGALWSTEIIFASEVRFLEVHQPLFYMQAETDS